MRKATRWLVLLAMMLTPLAMQPAAAANAPAHHALASNESSHCDPAFPSKAHLPGDCSMACASALPAVTPSAMAQPAIAVVPGEDAGTSDLAGLSPESATPPPRLG